MSRGLELKVFLAGRVAIEANGVVVGEERFPGRQGRLLFACLVAEPGKPVPRDELAEALWGEAPPATWEKALTVLVSKLRTLLSECGLNGAKVLTSAFGCYRLNLPEGAWVDVIAAAEALGEAEAALAADDLEQAKAVATQAASLARPSFLPGEEGAWVDEKRRELTDVLHRALNCLAEACLRSGDEAEAAKWAEETIALEPYRETGYRRLMMAHAAAGNRAEALRVYERCRRLLVAELGTYPSPETESIYRELLEAPSPKPRAATSEAASAPVLEPERGTVPARRLAASQPSEVPFTAREGQLAEAAEVALRRVRLVRGRRALIVFVGAAAAAAVAGAAVLIVGSSKTASALRAVDANAIGVIDPGNNEIAAEIEVGAAPGHMAAGPDALWVTNADANTVSRIDIETDSVRQTIRAGSGPSAVAVGAEAVWATNGLERSVSRIDPETNEVVQKIDVGNGPAGIAVGEGAVWVANANDGSLSRIDPASGKVVATIDVGGGASAVAVGFGSVWVANGTSGSVSRVDPRANAVVQRTNVGNAPAALAVGFGAVWVANRGDGTVSRIDAEKNVVTATIPVAESPSAIAVGDDAVWVADELAAKLDRIDPGRNEVVRTLDVGNRPVGVVVVGDSVYVAVRATGTAHRGGTLRIRAEDIDTIDPAVAYAFSSWSILSITNDGLTAYRRAGGGAGSQLVPDLATALPTPADGGRTYTFRLRRGIRYSTGAPVKAADFRRAIERALTAGAEAPARIYLAEIVGARKCIDSPRSCDLSRGIITNEAAGTVTFRLTKPDPDLPHKLALPFSYPVPVGVRQPKQEKPVPATGPYVIAASSKREIRLERNPNFRVWSKAAKLDGIPDTIVWRFGAPQAAQVAAVERGEADVAFDGVPVSLLERIGTRFASQLHVNPRTATLFVFLNTRVPPFDDVRVRKAVNYALDRNAVVQASGGAEQAQPTCQVLPPNLQGYRPYCPYTANPTAGGTWSGPDLPRARRLIDASGTRGMTVSLWGTKACPGCAAPSPVASLLRRLGYRVRLRTIDDGFDYFAKTSDTRNRVQAAANGWLTDYPSPFAFITVLSCRSFVPRTPGNLNLAGFCDRQIERDITRALDLQTSDLQAANELWGKIDRAITDLAPWLFLANPKTTVFVSERVGNLQFSPQWGVLLDQLWVR